MGKNSIVSLGKAGAIVVIMAILKINVPSKVVNSNGAGSAMMAGFAVSMIRIMI